MRRTAPLTTSSMMLACALSLVAGALWPQAAEAQDPMLGEIRIFAGNFAPRGWALCEGQLLPISQNTALFSILGTTYGGDGQTTFALPDLRGRVPMGTGQGPGLSSRVLGETGGAERITLEVSQMPAHTHGLPAHAHGLPATQAVLRGSSAPATSSSPAGNVLAVAQDAQGARRDDDRGWRRHHHGKPAAPSGLKIYNEGPADVSLGPTAVASVGGSTTDPAAPSVEPSGGNLPAPTLTPFLGVTYIIALQGIFPARN